MGCGGGYRELFDIFDSCERPRRRRSHSGNDSCGSDSYYNDYSHNDFEEKMSMIKKMYAQDIIDYDEYQRFKQLILENNISFDALMEVRTGKVSNLQHKTNKAAPVHTSGPKNEYQEKLDRLKQTEQKIIQVQDKLSAEIQGLTQEKERMEALADAMLKASEDKAEAFIRKRLDIEENIQRLEKHHLELQNQIENIENMKKTMQTKLLELEALQLEEEVSNLKLDY